MKKLTAALMALVIVLTLAIGCGGALAEETLTAHLQMIQEQKNAVNYTISTAEYGTLIPGDFDPETFVEMLLQAELEPVSSDVEPEGEYVVLAFPDEEIHFDFFQAPEAKDIVRQVNADESEEYFRSAMPEGLAAMNDIMSAWHDSIAGAQGLIPEITVNIPEEAKYLDGSAWVHERAGMEIFVEDVDNFKVLISWADSAFATTEWVYACSYDEEDHCLKAQYLICDYVEYPENGDEVRTPLKEEDSSAVIALNDQGCLVVTDESEPQLNGLAFEPVPAQAE